MMREAIDSIKRKISASKIGDKPPTNYPTFNVVYERLRGLVRLEENSGDNSIDYEIIVNFNNVTLRPLKNP